jgi:hypothetical protein
VYTASIATDSGDRQMGFLFETKSCSRCGGSGRYSFNLMHGDKCYGCGGSGLQHTKRGANACAFFHKSLEKPLSEIKVGDYILFDTSMLGGPEKWCKVEAIEAGQSPYIINGVRDESIRYTLHLTRKGKSVGTFGGLALDHPLKSVKNDEELNALKAKALEYQGTLSEKTGKPVKQKIQAISE